MNRPKPRYWIVTAMYSTSNSSGMMDIGVITVDGMPPQRKQVYKHVRDRHKSSAVAVIFMYEFKNLEEYNHWSDDTYTETYNPDE